MTASACVCDSVRACTTKNAKVVNSAAITRAQRTCKAWGGGISRMRMSRQKFPARSSPRCSKLKTWLRSRARAKHVSVVGGCTHAYIISPTTVCRKCNATFLEREGGRESFAQVNPGGRICIGEKAFKILIFPPKNILLLASVWGRFSVVSLPVKTRRAASSDHVSTSS